ncbi:hypothetical protein Pan258_22300 [Symmachiella dynata]|uniref:hypothetical protein n=1 Tax=Symmachiella dynata TaxID=2527995 RepID=UPI00118D19CD|nr:hypothetical protein [Symmachiella dynata]QDT48190.1 hypothetical protein Pan258_22300 [Symmachiella dynata]
MSDDLDSAEDFLEHTRISDAAAMEMGCDTANANSRETVELVPPPQECYGKKLDHPNANVIGCAFEGSE